MIWIIALLMLAFVPSAYADTAVMCVNSTHQIDTAQFIVNNTTTTQQVIEACPFSCSNDFQRCKPSPFKANLIGFFLITTILVLASFFIRKHNVFGLVLSSMMSIGVFLLGFVDIFSDTIRLFFALIGLMLIAVIGFSVKLVIKEDREEMNTDEEKD